MEPARLSDSELYKLCQYYGLNAKTWLRKFAGLLPEVLRRGLHRRRGCASIHEFAKKVAGMNERTTDKIINLHKRLQDKPALLKIFLSGEQGWSKLEAVVFIATTENEQGLAEMTKKLPRSAIVEYVENYRRKITAGGQVQNDPAITQAAVELLTPMYQEPNTITVVQDITAQVSKQPIFSVHLSEKSRAKLDRMKYMMEKRYRKTLTWDEMFKAWPIKTQETIIKTVCPQCVQKSAKSRPIPKAIQRHIFATHGYTCAFPGCHKPYQELHHVYPWAKYKTHDPKQIYPLCSTHHTLAHAGLIANMKKPPENWQIQTTAKQTPIDKKVMKFKATG